MKTTGYFINLPPEKIKEIKNKANQSVALANISEEYNLPKKVIAQIVEDDLKSS